MRGVRDVHVPSTDRFSSPRSPASATQPTAWYASDLLTTIVFVDTHTSPCGLASGPKLLEPARHTGVVTGGWPFTRATLGKTVNRILSRNVHCDSIDGSFHSAHP